MRLPMQRARAYAPEKTGEFFPIRKALGNGLAPALLDL